MLVSYERCSSTREDSKCFSEAFLPSYRLHGDDRNAQRCTRYMPSTPQISETRVVAVSVNQ
jgi:hypothetical protein